jgi:penicillin-binding protein 1A
MTESNFDGRIRLRRRKRRKNPLATVFIVGALLGVLGLVGVGVYIASVADSTPPLSSMTPRDPGSTSEVLAASGERLGFIQADALRVPISGKKIPVWLKRAMVAIEDERFYSHHGVDYEGVARAAVKNAVSNNGIQGGSTITMQLVRNLYISNEQTYKRKIREAKLAEEMEEKRSKSWILNSYLNTVPFGTVGGQTAVGVEAAARMYYGKPATKLTLGECALLAGLPQAPTTYSPIRAPEKAKHRRNEVLSKMAQLKMITPERAEKAMREPLRLKPSRFFLRKRAGASYFFDYVKDQLIKEYGERRVRQGGLKIHTTIDLRKQDAAKVAIKQRLAGVGPSAGIVTINPSNGHILAMATSSDYGHSQYNYTAQGGRQPGSTFKIMALMAALDRGINPDSTYYTSRHLDFKDKVYGKISVVNYGKTYGGSMNLTRATIKSDNTIYTQLAMDLGPKAVSDAARKMGITSPVDNYPSATLGGLSRCCTPLEMANAYATIASGGYRNRPTAITKIVLPNGRSEVPERFQVKRERAFAEAAAYKAIKILEQNIQSGTGTAAGIGCPAGGKTGTTDSFNDAWFTGFTPHLATATWVGFPDAQKSMSHHYHGGPVNGGSYPAQIWGDYMRVARGSSCDSFPQPKEAFVSKRFKGRYMSGKGSKSDKYSSDGKRSYWRSGRESNESGSDRSSSRSSDGSRSTGNQNSSGAQSTPRTTTNSGGAAAADN